MERLIGILEEYKRNFRKNFVRHPERILENCG